MFAIGRDTHEHVSVKLLLCRHTHDGNVDHEYMQTLRRISAGALEASRVDQRDSSKVSDVNATHWPQTNHLLLDRTGRRHQLV